MSVEVIDNPNNLVFKSLSKGFSSNGTSGLEDSILSFCWYPKASGETSNETGGSKLNNGSSLGRYGEFNPNTYALRLSYTNVFGEVRSPLRLGDKVLFSSSMYNGDSVEVIAVDNLALGDFEECGHFAYEPLTMEVPNDFISNSSGYSYFANLKRGVLFPFGMYGSFANSSGNEYISLGLTWLSSDPTSTVSMVVSGSYSKNSPSLWVSLSLSDIVDIDVGAGAKLFMNEEFKPYGYGFSFITSASKSFEPGANNTLTVGDTFSFSLAQAFDGEPEVSLSNLLHVSYSMAVSTGLGHYDVFAYSVSFSLKNIDPYVTATLVLPSLIPIKCVGDFTCNLPFRLDCIACYFVEKEEIALSASAKTTVFSHEIQKGYRFLGLYLRRISLDVKYNTLYYVFANSYSHNMEAYAHLHLSPVLGMYATQLKVALGAKLIWDFMDSPKVELSFVLN